jgi:hypothetical protein
VQGREGKGREGKQMRKNLPKKKRGKGRELGRL